MKIIKKKEEGFVLVIGLILLLIMTSLALYGTSTSILQEKNASNVQEQQVAFQNAEEALRLAENYVYANVTNAAAFDSVCTNGLCVPNNDSLNPIWNSIDWENDTTHVLNLSISNAYKQPKFIVELFDNAPNSPGESIKNTNNNSVGTTFRVTVTAWGNRVGSKAMVQSIFVKR